jgi:hypothetical protein
MRRAARMVVLSRNFDADAQAYITAVETADGAALEGGVKTAINNFVVGCKADGIWSAIKASCILAGARTLSGALVPLVGTAPTNFNFVSGDYNRKTGLVGDGSTKYLNSNRSGNADPQNSFHSSVYVTTFPTTSASGSNNFATYIGNITGEITGARSFFREPSNGLISIRNTTSVVDQFVASGSSIGLIGMERSVSASYTFRANNASGTLVQASQTPNAITYTYGIYRVFNGTFNETTHSNGRYAFYSIGESLDLALLDFRVTALINAYIIAIV